MKFKYIGQNNTFCIELVAYNIMSRDEKLMNGQFITVPDDNQVVIDALDASGLFVRVHEGKKVKDNKKEDKK